MITMIDSNVLIDIFGAHTQFGQASKQALQHCMQAGAVHACEIVWIEVAVFFPTITTFTKAMHKLGIEFSPINQDTALAAARAWKLYRKAGGKRERVAADFLIGAHAKNQGARLLTRDPGFYRHYFQQLTILDPVKFSLSKHRS